MFPSKRGAPFMRDEMESDLGLLSIGSDSIRARAILCVVRVDAERVELASC